MRCALFERVIFLLCQGLSLLVCKGLVPRVPHRPTHEKRITLTKKKSNTHKQRKLPNDERPIKGSNEHETHFLQISTDAKK